MNRKAAALVLLCAAYPFIAYAVLSGIGRITPTLYDGLLTRLDGETGHAAIVACARMLHASPALAFIARWSYDGSVLIAMLAIAARWRLKSGGDMVLPAALLIAGALAPLCYLTVPAVGPHFVGQNDSPRNAMPSLHFALALIVVIALWEVGMIARTLGLTFVALTILATLGFGEHYLIDLVLAVPFALGVWCWVKGYRPAAIAFGFWTATALVVIRAMG